MILFSTSLVVSILSLILSSPLTTLPLMNPLFSLVISLLDFSHLNSSWTINNKRLLLNILWHLSHHPFHSFPKKYKYSLNKLVHSKLSNFASTWPFRMHLRHTSYIIHCTLFSFKFVRWHLTVIITWNMQYCHPSAQ